MERVNALASTLLSSELMAMDEVSGGNGRDEETLIEVWNFAPEKGNVVFASAIDGWGFGIGRFAMYWAKQLSLNKNALQKYMFDDYTFNKNSKKISKLDSANSNSKPMFVSMILDPIWKLYDVAISQQNSEKAANMAKKLGVEIAKRDIYTGNSTKSHQTGASTSVTASNEAYRATLQTIMREWLPLADAILRTVVRTVPDPVESQKVKSESYFALSNMPKLGSEESDVLIASGKKVLCEIFSKFMYFFYFNLYIILLFYSILNTVSEQNKATDKIIFRDTVANKIHEVGEDVASCRSVSVQRKHVDEAEGNVNTVVFIAKMIPVRIADLSPQDAMIALQRIEAVKGDENNSEGCESETEVNMRVYDHSVENIKNTEVFLALGRVFSGTLSATSNSHVYCLGNHHDPYQYVGQDTTVLTANDDNEVTSNNISLAQVPLSSLSYYMCLGPSGKGIFI